MYVVADWPSTCLSGHHANVITNPVNSNATSLSRTYTAHAILRTDSDLLLLDSISAAT